MTLRGTAQRLSGADATAALLGMMDDEHGDGMAALEFAQKCDQRSAQIRRHQRAVSKRLDADVDGDLAIHSPA